MGDSTRPRGSFLLLGPSGVGKPKPLRHSANRLPQRTSSGSTRHERVFRTPFSHSPNRFTARLRRLEEGGQLTGAVSKEPYSLVLLDEIEKAHPKLFDLFLQLLDDGRLTDSSGHTVDFTETMVLATSNTGSGEITRPQEQGVDIYDPAFARNTILPILHAYLPTGVY